MPSRTDSLLTELASCGLGPVDAHRGAFTALACSSGWTKARVGRYLGISRARVGQKVDKLLHYATDAGYNVPTLTDTMRKAVRRKPERGDYDEVVQFTQSDWDDLTFARSLIDRIELEPVASDT